MLQTWQMRAVPQIRHFVALERANFAAFVRINVLAIVCTIDLARGRWNNRQFIWSGEPKTRTGRLARGAGLLGVRHGALFAAFAVLRQRTFPPIQCLLSTPRAS